MFQKKYVQSFSYKLLNNLQPFSTQTLDYLPLNLSGENYGILHKFLLGFEWLKLVQSIRQKLTDNRRKAIKDLIDTLIP